MAFRVFYFISFATCIIGETTLQTRYGDIIGILTNPTFDDHQYKVKKFYGIPYALPPVGNRRFRKPVLLELSELSFPFEALKPGPACPQANAEEDGLTTSEDCLFLNVFVPETNNSQPKSVMVYIHSGGFTSGMSNFYDGDILAAVGDVIVVVMNYRLGPLGFFSSADANVPGNYGLWDQQLAIQWVNKYIKNFGGDNSSVTIFGVSAGGGSVVYQMMYKDNEGLFNRAIAQSGTAAGWAANRFNTNQKSSASFADFAGCGSLGGSEMIKCLRAKPTDEMKNLSQEYQLETHLASIANLSWVPVNDQNFVMMETDQILASLWNSHANLLQSNFLKVDFMTGVTNLDGIVLLGLVNNAMSTYGPPVENFNFTTEQLKNVAFPMAAKTYLSEIPDSVVLDAIEFEYTDWTNPINSTRRPELFLNLLSDFILNAPTLATALAHANSDTQSTYLYQFSTSPPNDLKTIPGVFEPGRSAGHGDDIPFVFGFTSSIQQKYEFSNDDITAEQIKVSKAIMLMWSNFAKTGDPNRPIDLQSMYEQLNWPLFDRNSQRYLEISPHMDDASVKTRLAARATKFWNDLLPKIQSLKNH